MQVKSFVIDMYTNGPPGGATVNWALRTGGTGGPIFGSAFGTETGLAGEAERTINTGAGFYEGVLVLEINYSDASGWVGIDDINFNQAVPEPASLSALAIVTTLIKRRRR